MARATNRPLLLERGKCDVIMRVLLERNEIAHVEGGAVRLLADDDLVVVSEREADAERAGYFIKDGIAVIPIEGTLVQKNYALQPVSGMLGYDGIRANFAAALNDGEVKGILFDVDSPGGEVPGCFDLADDIYRARAIKPVRAAINECSCSAAYALASSASRITIARTGVAGSIGVVWMHVDWSDFNEAHGIKITYMKFGDRKVDGNSDEPLSDEAAESIQAQINAVGEIFVNTVARNRELKVSAVRAQQAAIFQGTDAVAAGLADAIMPIDQAFSQFAQELKGD
jgi:signal peptide peptidase SppA